MSRFSRADLVRITDPASPLFDTTATIHAVVSGHREWLYVINTDTVPAIIRQHHLTLADKDTT